MKDHAFFRRIWLWVPVLLALAASRSLGEKKDSDDVASAVSEIMRAVEPDLNAPLEKKQEKPAEVAKPAKPAAPAPAVAKAEAPAVSESPKPATTGTAKPAAAMAAAPAKTEGPAPTRTTAAETASTPPIVHPAGSEIAIVLAKDRFFPSEIHVRGGVATTLVFSSVNRKPAALVIEPSQPGRAIASESRGELPGAPLEITRELGNDHVTTISFDPSKGKYSFHDALGTARGVIVVE